MYKHIKTLYINVFTNLTSNINCFVPYMLKFVFALLPSTTNHDLTCAAFCKKGHQNI